MKLIQCREHGGTFQIESRRGRPPVRCGTQANGTEYPLCSAASNPASKARVAEAIKSPVVQEKIKSMTLREWKKAARDAGFSVATINKMKTPAQFRELLGEEAPKRTVPEPVENAFARVREETSPPKRSRKAAQAVAEVESRVNPSVPKAHEAKALLEPLGWKVAGRASFDGEQAQASILAIRGDEQLHIVWIDGRLEAQNYSLWNMEKPRVNNTPDHKLPFEPDEMTDSELVRSLSGMKVTWWNRIGQSMETAVISKDKIKIDHHFDGRGDETPADRVVSFVDMKGGGFRSFRMGALLKIG